MLQSLPSVVDVLTDHPELAILAALLMRAAVAYQRELTWPEYRRLHAARRLAFPVLDRRLPILPWVNDKGGRSDDEYQVTLDATPRATVRDLRRAGASLHLLSSIKRRPPTHGDPLTYAHLVWTDADGTQLETYLFANADGTTDIYAHDETSVTDPVGHLTDKQTDGDPSGRVVDALKGAMAAN